MMEEIERLRTRVRELESLLDGESMIDPFRQVVESAPYGMVVSDAEGRVVMVNPQAVEMFGYGEDEFLTRRIEDLVPPGSRRGHKGMRHGFQENAKSRPMGAGRDLFACRRDGTEFPVEIALTPLKFAGETLILSSIIDITRRKRDEEDLQRYARRLEQSNAELESFASIASHDLQEPLRKIRMMGERLVALRGDDLGEQERDYLHRMIRAGDNMHRLIRDLLTISRVGMRGEGFRSISLSNPLRDALLALELLIEETGAEIHIGELPEAEVDESQMCQLFQNLIGNALKFRRRGVVPRVEVIGATDPLEQGDVVRIEVRDNGIGFDPQHRERIFQIFQRLHSHNDFEGTGIGLAICRKIVDRHDGRIYADGILGEGATFVVEFPQHHPASEGANHNPGRRIPFA